MGQIANFTDNEERTYVLMVKHDGSDDEQPWQREGTVQFRPQLHEFFNFENLSSPIFNRGRNLQRNVSRKGPA
jgi:hypothetical protein